MLAGGEHSFSMEVKERRGGAHGRRAAVALLAGLVVFVLQFPSLIIESNPPICHGMFGAWTVPCGGWPAVGAGALVAGVGWLALSVWDPRTKLDAANCAQRPAGRHVSHLSAGD